MAAPAVHFAIGMSAAAVAGGAVCLFHRRWVIVLPLVAILCGLLAVTPDLLDWAGSDGSPEFLSRRSFTHSGWMNVFVLHPWLDGRVRLETASAAMAGFQACVFLLLACVGGYAAFITRRLPAMSESEEALGRMGAALRSYRVLGIVPALAPLLVTGVAMSWIVLTAGPPAALEREVARRRDAAWADLVKRRMGVDPGDWLGVVRTVPEEGHWLVAEFPSQEALMQDSAPVAFLEAGQGATSDTVRLTASRKAAEDGVALLQFAGQEALAGPVAFAVAAGRDERLLHLLRLGRVIGLAAGEDTGERALGVGGAWDGLLDSGFTVWGASMAAGARMHVWCASRSEAGVLRGLRDGCFWTEQGGIVRRAELEVAAGQVLHPARMGEIVRAAPGTGVSVDLALDIPEKDAAGRPNVLDVVEMVANADGEAEVVGRWKSVRGTTVLRHVLEAPTDRNGGVGLIVRARGRRRLEDGTELWFHTNPVRVLLRDAPVRPSYEPPSRPRTKEPVVEPEQKVEPKKGDNGAKQEDKRLRHARLEAAGLPATVDAVLLVPHNDPPGREWTGVWEEHVGDRAAALRDVKLRIALAKRIPTQGALRLSFRCYPVDCRRITVQLRTTDSTKAYSLVYELPNGRWTQVDVSLREDFHNPAFSPARLASGGMVQEIEWLAEPGGPRAAFYIADVVAYHPTPASRLAVLRDRAEALEQRRKTVAVVDVSAERYEDFTRRLSAFHDRTAADVERYAVREIEELDRELAGLEREWRLLDAQATMARAFGVDAPAYVVSTEGAMRRVSSRNPALRSRGNVESVREVWAAAGESESVQIIVGALWKPLRAVEVAWSGFRKPEGGREVVPVEAVHGELVSEVLVYPQEGLPSDRSGWTPDPLQPLQPFDVAPGEQRCVLLTVETPADAPPGDYEATVHIRPLGEEPVAVKLILHRWAFALADRYLPVLGVIDVEALKEQEPDTAITPARLRGCYDLLLRHRVDPVPMLSGDPERDLADLVSFLERGAAVAVVHHAAGVGAPLEQGLRRGDEYAMALRSAGWRRRAAALLPMAARTGSRRQYADSVQAAVRRHPVLRIIAGGQGDPPTELTMTYWRRPLLGAAPELPRFDIVDTRRTRTVRREAWSLAPGAPDYPQPNFTLTNRLVESRSLLWLAWKHGVRALVLENVNQWRENNRADGMLVYPGQDGRLLGSLRLVALRDAIEDYETLWHVYDRWIRLQDRAPQRHIQVLEAARQLLQAVELGTGSYDAPIRDPEVLQGFRLRMGTVAQRLERAWWEEVDTSDDLPKPPPAVEAKAGDETVALTWEKSPDAAVTGYMVYRSRDPELGYVRVTPQAVSALTTMDRTVQNGVTYHYILRAVDEKGREGPRSPHVTVRPEPAPRVVWLDMHDLSRSSRGPYRVHLGLRGPLTGGIVPLIVPQIDTRLSDTEYDGYADMTRLDDRTWEFETPDPDWRLHGGKTLYMRVQLVDRSGRVVTPAVERKEFIDADDEP